LRPGSPRGDPPHPLLRIPAAQRQAPTPREGVRVAYWTLLGYFNSLRLLGAAELQVNADVNERLRTLAPRDGVEPRQVLPTEITNCIPFSDLPALLGARGRSL
jgi:hypothetical protein